MRAGFDNWWLLPLGVLAASVLVVSGLVVFGPSFSGGSFAGAAHHAASEVAVADCSGASKLDYACYEQRYHDLVLDSGVAAAFTDLKDEHEKNGFVRVACHDLTHAIGHAAGELYGDLATAYDRGDPYCAGGYYHGVTGTVVRKMGADKVLEEVDEFCADLREQEEHSFRHYSCAHGLGHGFMAAYENELFESLKACDTLADRWEREACYSGIFIENATAIDPSRPSKYLRADQPLYPCTEVEARYKNECYEHQTDYTLYTQNDDYAKVFDLCATVAEEDFRPACYQGLGGSAAAHSIKYVSGDEAKAKATRKLCMLGQDDGARSNCVMGAVRNFIHYYNSDEQAKALCETLEADLRAVCLKRSEDENFA